MRGWLIVCVLAAGCGDNLKGADAVDAKQPDAGRSPIERGRYIMNNLGACTFCHTPLNPDGSRDLTRLFAGVDCLFDVNPVNPNLPPDPADGFGCLSSRNLTNDATGLMFASDAQIKYAFTNGYRVDGKPLAPVMPYAIFHNMTDDDANAIVAYLRTVPGVNHVVGPNQAPWTAWNDGLAPPVKFMDLAKIPMPDPAFADQASALRGRYLSGMVGLCIDCHTPTDPATMDIELDQTKFYTGGRLFPALALGLLPLSMGGPYPEVITTRNVTSDVTTGIGSYSLQQVKDAIANGKDPDGKAVCAGTHGSAISPYAALDPEDLTDIANYMKSLAPVAHDTSPNCQGPPVP